MKQYLTYLSNFWIYFVALFVLFTALKMIESRSTNPDWNQKRVKSGGVNLLFAIVNPLFSAVTLLSVFCAAYIYDVLRIPTLDPNFWNAIPQPLQILFLLLIYDFGLYWAHRLLHWNFFWVSHAVHHSDTQINFLTWSRSHFTEHLVLRFVILLTSLWVGVDIYELAFVSLFMALHQHYVHSNLDWDHGILKNIIVSPTFHKWHHADVKEAYDKNFASIFPVYDILFNTYYCPGSAKNVPTGFEGNPGDNFTALMAYPFIQWGMKFRDKYL